MVNPHRMIPALPDRPIVVPIKGQIRRSYPVGKKNFSRAFKRQLFSLSIKAENKLPDNLSAKVVFSLASNGISTQKSVPYLQSDDHTLICLFTPDRSGLHSFWTEFSNDGGLTWIRDTVPDGWILIDPPQVDGLRLYTLIPNVSGTINDWKEDLKRIKELGFNAVHLLPITSLDSSESPYSIRDLFDIDTSYLDTNSKKDANSQLEEYTAEASKLGISLCFDIVMNHVGVNSRIAQKAPDWIIPDQNQPDGFRRAGYWSEHGWLTWNDLILINYEHPSEIIRKEIWEYMRGYSLFWAKFASETGGFIRFDNLHSSDPGFIQYITDSIHAEYPDVALLGEFFTDETTLLQKGADWGLNLNLATPWNYRFVPQLRDYLTYLYRSATHLRYFMPVTTHDSGTPYQEFGSVESTVPRYVAAALLGTGATGITQGIEYGIREKVKFIGRQSKIVFPDSMKFADIIRKVNKIHQEHMAFRYGGNSVFVDKGHDAIIGAFRYDPDSKCGGFLILCNFDIFNAQHLTVDLVSLLDTTGPFLGTELISGEIKEFSKPVINFLLEPCQAIVIKFN